MQEERNGTRDIGYETRDLGYGTPAYDDQSQNPTNQSFQPSPLLQQHTPEEFIYEGWLKKRSKNQEERSRNDEEYTNIDYAIFQPAPETGGYILEIMPAKNHQDSTIYELDDQLIVRRTIYRNGGIIMHTVKEPIYLARTQKTIEETLEKILQCKTKR